MPKTTPIAVNESMADRPHGWPRLNAQGDLEGPLVARDGDDAASGGGVADVPEKRELVARAGSVAVGDGVSEQGNRVALSREAYRSPLRCEGSFIASSSSLSASQALQTASGQGYSYRVDHGVPVSGPFATNTIFQNPNRIPQNIHSFPVNPESDYFTRIVLAGTHGVDLAGLSRLENLSMSTCRCRLLDFRGLDSLKILSVLYITALQDPGRSDVAVLGLEALTALESIRMSRVPDLGDVVLGTTPDRLSFDSCPGLRSLHLPVAASVTGDNERITGCADLTAIRAEGVRFSNFRQEEDEDDESLFPAGLNISNNALSAEALNQFFSDLAPDTGGLDISNNPGTTGCDPAIATAKGYRVIVDRELVGVG